MKENKITYCFGSTGCLLRESCENYKSKFDNLKHKYIIPADYSVKKGCPNYKARKIYPVIVELIK